MIYNIIVAVLMGLFSVQVQASQASSAELVKPKKAPLSLKRNEAELTRLKALFASEEVASNNIAAVPMQTQSVQINSNDEEKKEACDKNSMTVAGPSTTKLVPIDPKELTALAKQYKDGISVKGVPGLSKVNLTKKALEHVFGITITKDKKSSEGAYLSGFHHDYLLQARQKKSPFYFSSHTVDNGIREGFIAFKKTDTPVYKTFFSLRLTKEEIIKQLIESLQDVQRQEDQPQDKLLLEGVASNGIIIRTIINKKTGNIVTFFPVTQTSEDEIKAEQQKITQLFEKFFRNRENKPTRMPITDKEIDALLQQFPRDIPFNMVLVKIDLNSPAMHREWAMHFPAPVVLPPTFDHALVGEKQLAKLLKKYPGRITVEGNLKTLHLTSEALKKIFLEEDAAFPPYLTRVDILHHVMEAFHAMEKIGPSEINGKMTETEIQALPAFDRFNGLLMVKGRTEITPNSHAFLYWVGINEKTGDIEKFFPSPEETVRRPILGCQIK